jgi:hypothetical protein
MGTIYAGVGREEPDPFQMKLVRRLEKVIRLLGLIQRLNSPALTAYGNVCVTERCLRKQDKN